MRELIAAMYTNGPLRIDVADLTNRSAVLVRAEAAPALFTVELLSGSDRHLLRPAARRATHCWASGQDGALPSDAAWDAAAAADAVIRWMSNESVSPTVNLQRVVESDVAQRHSEKRVRMYEAVEQYRRLGGRWLVDPADLHAFLLGVVGVAGATRMPLVDVVKRADPRGTFAGEAHDFAAQMDLDHETAHRIQERSSRVQWLTGRIRTAVATSVASEHGPELQRKILRYLECELGRSPVSAR
ncbi:hypothetical protein [Microbacterium gorillae]|uniref:hypothetical protein n=1 Tax=Microbacterium gorillae TaxID=1231063 RepID=UPI003D9644D3